MPRMQIKIWTQLEMVRRFQKCWYRLSYSEHNCVQLLPDEGSSIVLVGGIGFDETFTNDVTDDAFKKDVTLFIHDSYSSKSIKPKFAYDATLLLQPLKISLPSILGKRFTKKITKSTFAKIFVLLKNEKVFQLSLSINSFYI